MNRLTVRLVTEDGRVSSVEAIDEHGQIVGELMVTDVSWSQSVIGAPTLGLTLQGHAFTVDAR